MTVFKVFPDLIDRDRINITAANRKKDIRYVAENNQFLQALREADRLAQGMIAPFGECLHEIYRQTGDLDFIQTTLSGLLPPLRDLGDLTSPSRHRYPERFSEDAAAALVKLWREIFVFAYDRGGVIESLNPQKLKSSCRVLERFSLDVSRDSYRGFPGARKSDSASSDGNGGAGDGEGILEGSAHTGSLDRGDRRERTRGGASARRQRLDCDPLDRSLDDDRQRRSQARDRPHPLAS
jgi:hypothetical protein